MQTRKSACQTLSLCVCLSLTVGLLGCIHTEPQADSGWRKNFPPPIQDLAFTSSADGSTQRTLFLHPGEDTPVPMLVALHTWSDDYHQDYHSALADYCVEKKWAFLHPNFRGANRTPAACGSDLAVTDIKDAVAWAQTQAQISSSQVYLVGTSGGGHMTLLMAGRAPELWAGVSAWVGISDLAAWHRECSLAKRRYAGEMVLCCGGAPGTNAIVDAEYEARSPLTHLHRAAAADLQIDINAGITDGHTGSVPISHSLRAFNALVQPSDRVPDEAIAYMTSQAKVPADLVDPGLEDASYGDKPPLYRKTSGNARITIFGGGHEMVTEAVLHWLNSR